MPYRGAPAEVLRKNYAMVKDDYFLHAVYDKSTKDFNYALIFRVLSSPFGLTSTWKKK